jgi:hypothetical protein
MDSPIAQLVPWSQGADPRNWLCFARLPRARVAASRPRALAMVFPARLGPIGFVFPVRPPPSRPRVTKLGSFRTIGFVLPKPIVCAIYHNSFPAKHLPLLPCCRNWVRFAQKTQESGIGCRVAGPFVPNPQSKNWLCLYIALPTDYRLLTTAYGLPESMEFLFAWWEYRASLSREAGKHHVTAKKTLLDACMFRKNQKYRRNFRSGPWVMSLRAKRGNLKATG